jgi:hypothetical protein
MLSSDSLRSSLQSYALTRQFHKKSSVLKDYYPYRRGQIGVQGRELSQKTERGLFFGNPIHDGHTPGAQ